jgi:phosphonate transport system permease protein
MVGQPALDPPLGASHFTWETVISSTITTIAITAITTIISAITAPCFSAWLLPAI